MTQSTSQSDPQLSPKRPRKHRQMTVPKHEKRQMSHQLKNRQLSRRKLEVAWEMSRARTITEAAAATGVSRRTIHRWLHDDHFCEALAEVRGHQTNDLRQRLHLLVDVSLWHLLKDTNDPDPAIRIRAARAGLEAARHFAEWGHIQDALRNSSDVLPSWAAQSPNGPPSDSPALPQPALPPPLAFPPPPGVD